MDGVHPNIRSQAATDFQNNELSFMTVTITKKKLMKIAKEKKKSILNFSE